MIVLDTNIISEMMGKHASERVHSWLNRQQESELFLTTSVIAELSGGALEFERRTGSRRYIVPLRALLADYASRIFDFRREDAMEYGRVIASRNAIGRPVNPMDAMIAATCLVNGATLATRNVRDFDGLDLKLVNPFET